MVTGSGQRKETRKDGGTRARVGRQTLKSGDWETGGWEVADSWGSQPEGGREGGAFWQKLDV